MSDCKPYVPVGDELAQAERWLRNRNIDACRMCEMSAYEDATPGVHTNCEYFPCDAYTSWLESLDDDMEEDEDDE